MAVAQVRSGLIGAGMIGVIHARAVRAAGGQLVAVAGSSRASGSEIAQRLRADACDSVDDLIARPDIDVVHICTPNHLHADMAQRALAAGKHVICEKPLSTDVKSARRLVDLASETGLVAAVPFVYRFYPTVREARQRVLNGDVGPVRLIHGSYLQDWLVDPGARTWRLDPVLGGQSRAFGDIGIHWCDLIEFVSGHRIQRLTARTTAAVPRRAGARSGTNETEDAASVMFETNQGALGNLLVSQITPGRKNRLWFSIDGGESSLAFDQELPDSLWVGDLDGSRTLPRGRISGDPEIDRYNVLPPGHPQGYLDSFAAFVADVYTSTAGGLPDGLPTFGDGLRGAILTQAVLDSAARRDWVEVGPR